jgi:DNA-binding IclR family transcriptional regulator
MASRAALAATRSLDVLNFLAANPSQPYSLTELARALDTNPSSMFGIVSVMTEAGYLIRLPFQKTYRLGPVAAAIGQAALHQDPLLEFASDEVLRLGRELEVEAVVVAAVGADMVTVARAGPEGSRFLSFVGQRVPHAAPVGSIFTAWADEGAVEDWLDRPKPELDEPEKEKYREVLDVVRHDQQAVVLIVDRAWRFGTSASIATSSKNDMLIPLLSNSQHRVYYIGIPVFDLQGKVSFGLFTSGTSTRLTVERINELADRLHDAATSIMNRIGAHAPTPVKPDRKATSRPVKKKASTG